MINKTVSDTSGKQYLIQKELGRGSFGVVYLAHDSKKIPFALKLIGPINHEEITESFKREVQAISQLKHKNLLQFFGQGEFIEDEKKYLFTVGEYCSEGNYRQVLSGRQFSLEKTVSEFQQILAGLEILHTHLIHRDIKPENILRIGEILKVADLGLSKSIDEATKTLTFKGSGTPHYMAPEIWERKKISPASDLYAIGIMLFEACTGQVPFVSDDIADLRSMHLFSPSPRVKKINASIPDHIDGIIKKLLEKDPVKRYQSAKQLAEVLKIELSSPTIKSVGSLRDRIRISHDTSEAQRLKEEQDAFERQQKIKRIEYMEQNLISQIDEIIEEINQGLHETQITRNTHSGGIRYSFSSRTLTISFFCPNALYESDTLAALKDELKKHSVIHAGAISIEDGGENREGWNMVLVKRDEELYGEWILIESDLSGMSGRTLKFSPAATDATLLAENLAYHWMHTMHSWLLKDKPLEQTDIERILNKFIP